ncbi:hypothetical protein GCM10023084_79170 [Streptomyces lacrimifluminis]|uniref:Uncharacterized protein n=1 Tax=Streptomyces lacrimifluminis TaxID=1500077 RepID=A0A917PBE4_9ACTN|nr:hypothetical protein GCM10012282_78040 [Streptomyces lacrimifluminis]
MRPWGEVVVIAETMSVSSESKLSGTCDFPEKPTGASQGTPGNFRPRKPAGWEWNHLSVNLENFSDLHVS